MTKKIKNCQAGVTLLELLVSLTILSIILLSVTGFFLRAGTFTAMNENRTVAVNVARNALMYVEKQPFVQMRYEFEEPSTEKWLKMCKFSGEEDYVYTLQPHLNDTENLEKVEEADCQNILVNDGSYNVTVTPTQKCIKNQDSMNEEKRCDEEQDSNEEEEPKENIKKYYIPITVKVRWKENEPEVELDGTIKSEDMR